MRQRTKLTLDPDVREFMHHLAEQERQRLGYKSGDKLPKGEYISRCVRQSREYREWLKNRQGA